MMMNEWEVISPLIKRKIFTPGAELMSMVIVFQKGGIGAEHAHPHEQLGYVISGEIRITLDGAARIIRAGEQVIVPGNVVHGVEALEDTVLLEVFTPLRKDLLAGLT